MDHQRFVERAGDDERFERQAPHPGITQSVDVSVRVVFVNAGERPECVDGGDAGGTPIVLAPDQRFEALGDAETVGDILRLAGERDQRRLRAGDVVVGLIGKPADRLAQRSAPARLFLVIELCDQRGEDGPEVQGARWPRLFRPTLGGLADRIGRFGADFRKRELKRGKEVGNERRPLEASYGADRENRRLRIAAANARAQGDEIDRPGGAPFLGLQDRQPRRRHHGAGLSVRDRWRGELTENTENTDQHGDTEQRRRHGEERGSLARSRSSVRAPRLRGSVLICGLRTPCSQRRCRVAAEYSSICFVKSCG